MCSSALFVINTDSRVTSRETAEDLTRGYFYQGRLELYSFAARRENTTKIEYKAKRYIKRRRSKIKN